MSSDLFYNACHYNKSHKLPFSTSIVSFLNLFKLFFWPMDFTCYSHDGFKYHIIFFDHFTKYIWFYPFKQKTVVKNIFVRFKAIVETHFQNQIQTLCCDNDGEYLALANFLSTHGITHLTTLPLTLEHNGYIERHHHHIVEMGLTLLSHASFSLSFWPHAFATSVNLINRMPTPTISFLSPYEKIFGFIQNYSKLRIFGYLCYSWLRPYSYHKLESRLNLVFP